LYIFEEISSASYTKMLDMKLTIQIQMLDLSILAGMTLRLLRCVPEVYLLITLLPLSASYGSFGDFIGPLTCCEFGKRRSGETTLSGHSERGFAEEGIKNAQRPADTFRNVFLCSAKNKRCNGADVLVHIAKNRGWADIVRIKLANGWEDDVARCDLQLVEERVMLKLIWLYIPFPHLRKGPTQFLYHSITTSSPSWISLLKIAFNEPHLPLDILILKLNAPKLRIPQALRILPHY
jgi:hypothetical protein